MNKNLKVKCPHCDILFSYYESEFRPFCCERCKMVDLGHWFKESYTVPTNEAVTELEEKRNGENENESEHNEHNEDETDY